VRVEHRVEERQPAGFGLPPGLEDRDGDLLVGVGGGRQAVVLDADGPRVPGGGELGASRLRRWAAWRQRPEQ
jgi:hypothetical protein